MSLFGLSCKNLNLIPDIIHEQARIGFHFSSSFKLLVLISWGNIPLKLIPKSNIITATFKQYIILSHYLVSSMLRLSLLVNCKYIKISYSRESMLFTGCFLSCKNNLKKVFELFIKSAICLCQYKWGQFLANNETGIGQVENLHNLCQIAFINTWETGLDSQEFGCHYATSSADHN